jgi:hypothetical protein
MKHTLIALAVLLSGTMLKGQVGMNCQYFPGGQVGFVSVKSPNSLKFSKVSHAAAFPILMIDRMTSHWYTNLDMSAFYYAVTSFNKSNDNRVAISKAEGSIATGRLGYVGGDGDQFRIGGYLAFGMSTTNLDSLKKPFDYHWYTSWGVGLLAYQKFGKFRAMGKLGYEIYTRKNYISRGSGFYFEGTLGYSFYQKYGISVMPCFYHKGFNYFTTVTDASSSTVLLADASMNSFVLKFGLTKFF